MRYFTSDQHFGHLTVLDGEFTSRGQYFSSIEHHDSHLIDQINEIVQRNDELYVLGDFSLSTVRAASKYRPKIRCRKVHLIMGNHDKFSYRDFFSTAQDTLVTRIGPDRTPVFLSHYPHAYWPGSHRSPGWLHLYGHTHTQYEDHLDHVFPGRRSMECSVDNAMRLLGEYRPFSEEDVLRLLGNNPGHERRRSTQGDSEIVSNLRR